MRRVFVLLLGLGLAAAAVGQGPSQQPADFDAAQARVYRAAPGQSLVRPAPAAAPADLVARFLAGRGVSAAVLASLRTAASEHAARSGVTHLRMEQSVARLRVEGAYLRATVTDRGALVHVIDSLAPVSGRVAPASVSEEQALAAALAALHPELPAPSFSSRAGNVASFQKTDAFYAPPTVERVAIPMKDGSLKAGFLVETWTQKTNLLHDTLVSGSGQVLAIELRTNTDRYNVFTDNPNVTPQAIVNGPGAGNTESPIGWLAGSQLTTNIGGNNAHAYLDTDANDKPDPGGSVATTDFLTSADLTVEPSTDSNKEVAVQNLFYLNNVIHDELYRHGFDEAAGNFQEDNFGKGGRGGDPVNAEAQDGSGLDNANFSTPHDGQNPRMQMFLWTGKGDHQAVVGGAVYPAQGAAFGPALDPTGISGTVLLAHDGAGASDTDGCETITTDLTSAIALIDRGNCTFVVKVKNAQIAGAVGVIIANQLGDSIFTMGGTDSTITIPSVMVGLTSGNSIKATPLPAAGTIRLTDPPPLHRDGDVDSDVVFHEYGHGLTWRMIGRMRGAMSGAVGEGMSDVLAVIMNDDDRVGEYSFSDPLGIRSAPYTNYPRTYGDVTGSEVHFDGEVYGAIGWLLYQTYLGNGLTKNDVLDDIVDGMNYTPAAPAFEDMRDGILSSVLQNHPTHECLVWDAFAHYGVGVGASSAVHGSTIIVTESFTLPAQCQP